MSTSLTIHAYGFELIYSASLSIFFGSVGVMGNSLNQEGYENIIQKSFEDISHNNETKPSNPMHFDTAHDTAHSDKTHSETAHSDKTHSETTHSDTAHFDTTHSYKTHFETAHSDTAHFDTTHYSDTGMRKFVAVGKH